MDLNKILEPIMTTLDYFESSYSEYLKSESKYLNDILKYLNNSKGKRIRPALVFLSAGLCILHDQNIFLNDRVVKSAMIVEMIHTASLLHDDVVDNSEYRRGYLTVNYNWNNQTAILTGDYLLSKALELASDLGFEFTKLVISAFNKMCLGELNQLEKVKDIDISESEYFRNVKYKTGQLLGFSCEIGGMSVNGSKDEIKALRCFGENMGIAYQIKDDLIDYMYDIDISGKSAFNDIKNKKLTLPLIHSLYSSSEYERSELSSIIINDEISDESVNVISDILKKSNSLEYCSQLSEKILKNCVEDLQIFKSSNFKNSLIALTEFVRLRKL